VNVRVRRKAPKGPGPGASGVSARKTFVSSAFPKLLKQVYRGPRPPKGPGPPVFLSREIQANRENPRNLRLSPTSFPLFHD